LCGREAALGDRRGPAIKPADTAGDPGAKLLILDRVMPERIEALLAAADLRLVRIVPTR
jgi:hypothetical protein